VLMHRLKYVLAMSMLVLVMRKKTAPTVPRAAFEDNYVI
jgi:hypothetical protein